MTLDTSDLVPATLQSLDTRRPLVAAYHQFEHVVLDAPARARAITALPNHPEYGALYLIQVQRQMVGYLAPTFGYSIEFGGRDAFVDELFIEPAARGHGLGSRVLAALLDVARAQASGGAGVIARRIANS